MAGRLSEGAAPVVCPQRRRAMRGGRPASAPSRRPGAWACISRRPYSGPSSFRPLPVLGGARGVSQPLLTITVASAVCGVAYRCALLEPRSESPADHGDGGDETTRQQVLTVARVDISAETTGSIRSMYIQASDKRVVWGIGSVRGLQQLLLQFVTGSAINGSRSRSWLLRGSNPWGKFARLTGREKGPPLSPSPGFVRRQGRPAARSGAPPCRRSEASKANEALEWVHRGGSTLSAATIWAWPVRPSTTRTLCGALLPRPASLRAAICGGGTRRCPRSGPPPRAPPSRDGAPHCSNRLVKALSWSMPVD